MNDRTTRPEEPRETRSNQSDQNSLQVGASFDESQRTDLGERHMAIVGLIELLGNATEFPNSRIAKHMRLELGHSPIGGFGSNDVLKALAVYVDREIVQSDNDAWREMSRALADHRLSEPEQPITQAVYEFLRELSSPQGIA